MGHVMEWGSRTEESGVRQDCGGLTKEFGLYPWVRVIQWLLLSGYNQIYVPERSFPWYLEDEMTWKKTESREAS